MDWREKLNERELKEVVLSQVYATQFHHGTTGHNQLMLIAKLADLLDEYGKPAFSGAGKAASKEGSGNE